MAGFVPLFVLLICISTIVEVRTQSDPKVCPSASAITPCQCSYEVSHIHIKCSGLRSVSQLSSIFRPLFPVREMWSLTVDNSDLGPLPDNVFHDKSFVSIRFNNVTGLTAIEKNALEASQERLADFAIANSHMRIIDLAGLEGMNALVDLEVASSFETMTNFPTLPKLEFLMLYNNIFTSPPTLPKLPKLMSLSLYSSRLTSIDTLNFENLPSLQNVYFFDNNITELRPGSLHFSSNIHTIDLSRNQISSIALDTFKGIGKDTRILLTDNQITVLDERIFRPILELMNQGEGSITLAGNPLDCSCSLAWLVKEKPLVRRVSTFTSCADGRDLSSLKPHMFTECGH